jgi:hypothetical protein
LKNPPTGQAIAQNDRYINGGGDGQNIKHQALS